MILQAKILPHYFEQIKYGDKKFELRQISAIELQNAKTGEIIVREVKNVSRLSRSSGEYCKKKHADIPWTEGWVYYINLGKRLDIAKAEGEGE